MLDKVWVALAMTLSLGMTASNAQAPAALSGGQITPNTVQAAATQQVPPGCHPSYLPAADGSCVPIAADVHCARNDGKGSVLVKGPFRVIGHDEYDLDFDADGTACNRDKQ
jgi:hypothetical protein